MARTPKNSPGLSLAERQEEMRLRIKRNTIYIPKSLGTERLRRNRLIHLQEYMHDSDETIAKKLAVTEDIYRQMRQGFLPVDLATIRLAEMYQKHYRGQQRSAKRRATIEARKQQLPDSVTPEIRQRVILALANEVPAATIAEQEALRIEIVEAIAKTIV